jgi:hypothetical protein
MSPKPKSKIQKTRQRKLDKKRQKSKAKKKKPPHKPSPSNLPPRDVIKDYPEDFLTAGGPIIEAEIRVPKDLEEALKKNNMSVPEPVRGYMLIDTGASTTMLAEHALKQLQLRPTDVRKTIGIHGKKDVFCYRAQVIVDRKFEKTEDMMSCELGGIFPDELNINLIGLLGREFLHGKTFICDFKNNRVTIKR